MTFMRPFESGLSGWRWYHRFLREYPDMKLDVANDCYAAMPGLVIA